MAEYDGQGTLLARFVYGTSGHAPDYMVTASGQTLRLVRDQLGSVRLVVDVSSGVVRQRMDYDAFGRVLRYEERDETGTTTWLETPAEVTVPDSPSLAIRNTHVPLQPFGFAGGLWDPVTRLVRFGARDYDPNTGRWMAKDPIRFAGGDSNLFAYVGGDPVNGVDPTGTRIKVNLTYEGPFSYDSWMPDEGMTFAEVDDFRSRVTQGCRADWSTGKYEFDLVVHVSVFDVYAWPDTSDMSPDVRCSLQTPWLTVREHEQWLHVQDWIDWWSDESVNDDEKGIQTVFDDPDDCLVNAASWEELLAEYHAEGARRTGTENHPGFYQPPIANSLSSP